MGDHGTVLTDTSTLGRYYTRASGPTPSASPAWPCPSRSTPATPTASTTGGTGQHASPPPWPRRRSSHRSWQFFEGVSWPGRSHAHHLHDGSVPPPPAGGGPTSPLASYGYQGAPPLPSYASPADYTFIWYDATAKGPDEEGVNGTGLIRFVNGGARYKAGTVPSGPVPMFSLPGSVTSYNSPTDLAPAYPAWPGSPAAGDS